MTPGQPVVLAGPLVRRVDAKQVHLWIATSQKLDVTAEIFTLPEDKNWRETTLQDQKLRSKALKGDTSSPGGWSRTVRLGANLFVTLCHVTPLRGKKTFPRDELLFYDLRLDGKDLAQFGLLGTDQGIAYPGSPLPAFFIPERLTNFLHGSCHKLHGGGEDARTYVDYRLRETSEDLSQRPAVLLLTGDQIYGDDIAEEISETLAVLARNLLGYDEQLPGRPRQLTSLRPEERKEIATGPTLCGFTSGEADHHALGFGEFVSLHLLSWSPEAWSTFNIRLRELVTARAATTGFRRALANIATYMIFDDHDVTDDWNISPEWKQRSGSLNCSRRVVANALAAYWAFQGWGNDPEAFNIRSFVQPLEQHLAGPVRSNGFDDLLWGHSRWMYVTPTSPAVLALDLRTRRAMTRQRPNAAEPLMPAKDAYKHIQDVLIKSGFRKQQPLVVISTLPVIGFAPVEALQFEYKLRTKGEFDADWEGWVQSRSGRPRLFRFLKNTIQPSQCIFLSGDVHYGFAASGAFVEPSVRNELAVIQLTSSSLKNQDSDTIKLEEGKAPPLFVIRWWTGVDLTNREDPLVLAGWDVRPRSDLVEQLKAEVAEIVTRLLNPATTDRERADLTARQIQIAQELAGYETMLRDVPVILTGDDQDRLKIRDRASWYFYYNYEPFSGKHLAVGLTNIGQIRLSLPERIDHVLVTPMNGRFRFREQSLMGMPKVDYSKSLFSPDTIR